MSSQEEIKIEEENESPGDKYKKLREKLKKCREEKEEYLAGWQRAKADFINARREEEKNRLEFAKFANELLISELLAVLDSFDLAAASVKDKGLSLIQSQFGDILKGHGLEIIKTKGEKFDPQIHEAVGEVESDTESETVVEELQKGYKLNGKIIRPARVKIAK